MGKSPKICIVFKIKRVAEGDWQFEAHCPGVQIRDIKGFKSKAEADEWLTGTAARLATVARLRKIGRLCGT